MSPFALHLSDATWSFLFSLTLSSATPPPNLRLHSDSCAALDCTLQETSSLQPKQHCAEVSELFFVCVCVCMYTSPWKYVKAYGVSTEDWVSERKLIIPPSAVFWLSWRSRYSLVLLFSILLLSRTPNMKHTAAGLTVQAVPPYLRQKSSWQAHNTGNPFRAGLSLSDRETEDPSAENTSVHRKRFSVLINQPENVINLCSIRLQKVGSIKHPSEPSLSQRSCVNQQCLQLYRYNISLFWGNF